VPHLACFSVEDLDAEILSMALDDRGFRLAVGSNCSGASGEPSPVLEGMGIQSTPSFRLGVGAETTEDDVQRFLDALPDLVDELRRVDAVSTEAMSRFRAGASDPGSGG
jgi:cysteine desulfurase